MSDITTMDSQIRVVFFHIGSGKLGGGEKMLLRLLDSIDKHRFKPTILTQTENELCERARERDIEVAVVPFRGSLDTYNRTLLSNPLLQFPALFRIAQFNRDAKPCLDRADVIWCQNMRAVLTLFPYLNLSRTPAIWNIGLGIEDDGIVKKLQWISLRTVDHVFIESKEQAKHVFGENRFKHHKDKFTIFHKGIDTNKFDPTRFQPPNDIIRIGTAASLTPRKGLRYLIEALPAVLERQRNVVLRIAGEAPDGHKAHKQELRSKVHELGIEECVEFMGWVDDMPQFLSALDVFVLPSLNEGIPGAVREAMAMKVPVIATNVGGTADIVIDGETGYLIPPKDSQAIADRIIQILSDERTAQQMSERGYKRIQDKFSLKAYVEDYERFLSNIHSRYDDSLD